MESILCEHCAAGCCRHIALPLDDPSTARDYDDIRWYLMHENISVFVEEGDWYIQVQTQCKNLGVDNRCTIYETRPAICRTYKPDECDYTDGAYGYDHLFTHPKQIEGFYEKKSGRKLGPLRGQSPRPGKRRKKQTA